jgi:exopolysaccharide production protein ExoQ
MNSHIATIAYIAGIIGLFWLDRDVKTRISKAVWIPSLWLLIVGSRPVSTWLQSGPTISQAEQYVEGSPIDAAVYGVLIVAGAIALSSRRRQVAACLRENIPLVLFFSYCCLSIVWSDYSFVALKRWTKAVGDLMMILILLTDPDSLAAIKNFLSRAAFILMPLSVLFIKYYPDLGRSYNPWTWIPMYCGVTTFKNLLGMTCLVCGLGSLWSFAGAYRDRKMPYRVRHLTAHGIILSMTAWLLLTANSMTSLTCFAMGGALIVLTSQRRPETRIKAVHILTGGLIALSLCSLFVTQTMLSSLGRDPTLTGRTAIWQVVLSQHTNPLIGTGFESFWMGARLERIWQMTEKGIQEAHNGYLEVYLNLGWVGVGLLANAVFFGYRNALAIFRRNPHAGRIRLAFFTAGVIYSLTEAGFRMMSPIWITFLLAIACDPPQRQRRVGAQTSRSSAAQIQAPLEVVGAMSTFG